ncbi:MAG: YlxR family protein [Chloroflexi bacterium]|nr:MAG: YlxR family protein [Chloroflexota bacterium]
MPKRRHEPRRTCVACRQEGSKDELIRLVRSGEAVAVDPTGRAPGRGAYLHRRPECIEEARKKGGLNRALKAQVPDSVWVDLTP